MVHRRPAALEYLFSGYLLKSWFHISSSLGCRNAINRTVEGKRKMCLGLPELTKEAFEIWLRDATDKKKGLFSVTVSSKHDRMWLNGIAVFHRIGHGNR